MTISIKLLVIEDSEYDADLAILALRRGGFDLEYRRIQTAEELRAAIAEERWDAIISDYRMPRFSGTEALAIFKATALDIPFILVSGTIGEETAVAAMKAGASDYIMKKNLGLLAPALERALKEAATRKAHHRAQHDLMESQRRFSDLLQNVELVSLMLDREGRITYCNNYFLRLVGWSHDEVIGKDWFENFLPDDLKEAVKGVFAGLLVETPAARHYENEIISRSGERRLIRWNNSVLRSRSGLVSGTASIGEDITERKQAEVRIAHLNRVYAMRSEVSALIVRVRDVNQLFDEACRIAIEDGEFTMAWIGVIDKKITKIVPRSSAGVNDDHLAALKQLFVSGDAFSLGNTMAAQAAREKKPVISNNVQNDPNVLFGKRHAERGNRSMAFIPLMVADEAIGILALYADKVEFFYDEGMKSLTELAADIAFGVDHIAKEERLNYLAYYDVLTGLANRNLFFERLERHLHTAAANRQKLAVFVIDLERFKNINDSLGQAAGDALLVQASQWLTQNIGHSDLIARLDADHFAVVLPEVNQEGNVAKLIEKKIEYFMGHPFRLNDTMFRIAAKVGVALFPDDGADAGTLFRNAEAALKNAKTSGNRYLFYTRQMTAMVAAKVVLENQLRQALDKEEFVLHYQPKVSIATGKVTGAEALIRWNDPRTGLVPPNNFIPILEETGLIYEVGRWALRKAITDYLAWRAKGLAAVPIAVNVSPLQLRNRGFIGELKNKVSIDACAAEGLELEITESLIMEDVKYSVVVLNAIRDMGIRVAIDDFGTGFSSLSYLSKLSVDTLKIDRSFINNMVPSRQGPALVSTIISLAHALNLKVVAEGVETDEQLQILRGMNCDEMQGFLFSKALPMEMFESKYLTHVLTA